jgi:hypothetical protein
MAVEPMMMMMMMIMIPLFKCIFIPAQDCLLAVMAMA